MKNDDQKFSLMHHFKWWLYGIRIKLFGGKESKRKKSFSSVKKSETIFLTLFLAFPLIQFAIFYIGKNMNSILLAFQSYDIEAGKFYFSGLTEIKKVFESLWIEGTGLLDEMKRSGIMFLVSLVMIPVNVFAAYCVWKNLPFAGFFKIILFLPSVVPSIVFVLLGRYFFQYGIPELLNMPNLDLLDGRNPNTMYGFKTVLFFGCWMGFASGMVVYLGAMSGISEDVVEYGRLENMNFLQEFIYIVIPAIYPTITTYTVVAFAGFFVNYGYFFSFFGDGGSAPCTITLGHHFFCLVAGNGETLGGEAAYPEAAAGGFLFTAVVVPLTLLVKYLMEKYGPSEE